MEISDVRLTEEGIVRFEKMINDIRQKGKTILCPKWNFNSNCDVNCDICRDCFPKIINSIYCPCSKYDPVTTVAFLEQIIRQSKEEGIR